jgi:hypothetical protein
MEQLEFFPSSPTKGEDEKFVFDLLDVLQSPIIVYSPAWADTLPDDLKDNITLGRMINKTAGVEEASVPELVAYLYTASLEGPISSEWVKIYEAVMAEYISRFQRQGADGLLEELQETKLNSYEEGLKRDLARFIYKKRREALKEKGKKRGGKR